MNNYHERKSLINYSEKSSYSLKNFNGLMERPAVSDEKAIKKLHINAEHSNSESHTKKTEQISLSSSIIENYEIISENMLLSENETDNQNKSGEVLLAANTGSSSAIDSFPNQAENKPSQIKESTTPSISKNDESELNMISEKSEKTPLLELEPPTKKLVIQNMPQINIRPPLTLHKIFDIEIKPTGSFSYRSPDFRNIHYEEILSPLTKTIAQQTSSTLLKTLDKVDEVCSCGPQDIKVDLVQIPMQTGPYSEEAKLSSEEFTKFNSAELTKSDTDTVKLVSEISDKSCSFDTDSEELIVASSRSKTSIEKTTKVSLETPPSSESLEKSSIEKTTKVSSSKITDPVLQKSLEASARSDSLEKSSRLDPKSDRQKVIKTIPIAVGSKKHLKTKLDSKVGFTEKPAVIKNFVPVAASLPSVKSEASRASSAKKSFLNEAGVIKKVPEKVNTLKKDGTKTSQIAAAKRHDAKEKTKQPEIEACEIPAKNYACYLDYLQRKEIETSASRHETVDIQREQFSVQSTQVNESLIDPQVSISAQENLNEKCVSDADSKDIKTSQLTGLFEQSITVISESEPNIKYINEAYREQTVSEKQFGPHAESSTSTHSVPEADSELPSVSKIKMHLHSDFFEEVECECNLVPKASALGQIPITLSDPIKPQIPLQKSSESVYVLTHDISIQSSPIHLPVAKNSIPVRRKSSSGKRNSSGRGSKVKYTQKRSTFKSPVSSKISYSTKSNERSLTFVQRPSLKGSLTQRQSNPKKINNLSKSKGRESTEVGRPNNTGVSTFEASKRYDVIPEETIPQQGHSSTVMSVAMQYQVQKSLVDVLYPTLHKSRNCKDLDTSSSEFDGYIKLCKNKLSDDTEDSSINSYKMHCGDAFDYLRKYQVNGGDEVNFNKFKKIVRRPKQTISYSSASNSASHKLEESLSEGEIRCKCSISIGELHICRYVQQLKNGAKDSRRKRDESPSCHKWETSKSESSTKIDSTEPSSDT